MSSPSMQQNLHPNVTLLHKLFNGLKQHDHNAMAACYHSEATFHDIAFDLQGRKQIHAMWHMICQGDIRTEFNVIGADNQSGQAKVTDDYTFSSTQRKVHNVIESRFRFRDGLIIEQHDSCDARRWAAMAFGGIRGVLAGSFHFLRSKGARKKLLAFVAAHPEYR